MSNNVETKEKKVKVVVISPFTDKENEYLLRTPKLNNEYETTEARAQELIEKGKVKYAAQEPEFKLNKKSLTVKVGESEKLVAKTTEETTITWASSDEAVVTVDAEGNITAAGEGNITAAGEGKATITATTEAGDSASCKVTVKAE